MLIRKRLSASAIAFALVGLGGCQQDRDAASLEQAAVRYQARFDRHMASLDSIVADVIAWRERYGVDEAPDRLLLSLFTRPLFAHPEPSARSERDLAFQTLEARVAAHERDEAELARDWQELRAQFDSIAAARPEEVTDTVLRTPHDLAALPMRACPFLGGGCGDPRTPCDFVITKSDGRRCYLVYERCEGTDPPGGWFQECRYRCVGIIAR